MIRERKHIYFELLVTVGLFVIPSLLKAIYHFQHPDEPLVPPSAVTWQFCYMIVIELLILGLVWHIGRLNSETLDDFTQRFSGKDLLRGFGLSIWAFVACYGTTLLLWKMGVGVSESEDGRRSLDSFQVPFSAFYLLAMIVNPFAEEFLVRGFLQTRLRQAALSAPVAILISAGLQTSYHLYQGLLACLSLAPSFAIFALYYHAYRRLWPVIVAHLIMDLVAMLAYMKG